MRKRGLLKEEYSYIDITKPELLEKNDILEKIGDKENRFRFAAKLCDKKFIKLRDLYNKMRKRAGKFPVSTLKLLKQAFDEVVDEKVKELGLN